MVISQLIGFSRVSCHVADSSNIRNQILTATHLKQGNRYHRIVKLFKKVYHLHYNMVSKFNVGLKFLLKQGMSEPVFYGDFV